MKKKSRKSFGRKLERSKIKKFYDSWGDSLIKEEDGHLENPTSSEISLKLPKEVEKNFNSLLGRCFSEPSGKVKEEIKLLLEKPFKNN